ncbi:MAG: TetR/AcrR family transcriptional regulator [Bacteroidales bacterium]|jgi:AcrR family transcriptional regulator|nr:TetR/AcrR family transcriptional regulator [Bacteroidales bacterium]
MAIPAEYITKIAQMFTQYGIRNITMDYIAREIGVSKKTLYTWAQNKEELLSYIIDYIIKIASDNECDNSFKKKPQDFPTAVDAILYIMDNLAHITQNINPIFMLELNKFYPQLAIKLDDFRYKHIRKKIMQNIVRGKLEGLYRTEINEEIISYFYLGWITQFSKENIQTVFENKYSNQEILRELYLFHLNALLSDKGREYLKERITKNKYEND